MDFSIIVTVYNKAELLSRCLDSLLEQQFSGTFEIIAVNDASTDGSLRILEEYAKREENFSLVALPENRKQAHARARGMAEARGDFILHMDADDWMLEGALERIHGKLEETGADVLVFNFIRARADGETIHPRPIREEGLTRDRYAVAKYFMGGAVTKAVRRELTVDMEAAGADINTTEDLLYCVEILLRASVICLIPDEFYVYYINRESVTFTTPADRYLSNQEVVLRVLDRILACHSRDRRLVRVILNFVEKWIYAVLAESWFVKKEKQEMAEGLQEAFALFPEFTEKDLRNLRAAFRGRIPSLLQFLRHFGLRSTAGMVLRGFGLRATVI
jgi:glycosyltransferase involved in cell wall biosynthesis